MRNKDHDFKLRFAEIYKQHFPSIYRFIYRLTGEAEEAKDITQDAFVKLCHYMQKKEAPMDPRAWLFKVSANTCYTFLKRKERHRKIIENEAGNPSQQQQNVEDHLMKVEEITMLRNALNQLSVQDRIILELYQGSLSYQEIASIVKVKASTVGKKLFRARHKLAQEIKKSTKNKGDLQ
jgi:RNA polymerase sigma-70 factor (ECF subfamily)